MHIHKPVGSYTFFHYHMWKKDYNNPMIGYIPIQSESENNFPCPKMTYLDMQDSPSIDCIQKIYYRVDQGSNQSHYYSLSHTYTNIVMVVSEVDQLVIV